MTMEKDVSIFLKKKKLFTLFSRPMFRRLELVVEVVEATAS